MEAALVKNADRMMLSATALEEGIEVTFVDGHSGLIPFHDVPEVAAGEGLARLEVPNPYEIVVVLLNGESTEVPWDFARHYCDQSYRPRAEAIARQGRESLGLRIRELREAAGLTQGELAENSAIGRVTLVRIEQGDQSPRYGTLTAIARALDLAIEDLLVGSPQLVQAPGTSARFATGEIEGQIERDLLEMSGQQRAVLEALRSHEDARYPLSQWYQGALDALRNRRNPDRLSQAGQSLRELMEKLPRVVRGSDIQQMSKYNFQGKRQSLRIRLDKDKRRYADGWLDQPIDRQLAKTLEEFEAYLIRSQMPSYAEQIQLAVASIDPLASQMDIAIRNRKREEMASLSQRMQAFAHHNTSDPAAFDHWLGVLDRTILDLLAPITAENQQEIQSILQNSERTADDVDRMFRLIERRGANYVFFFAEASDPSWIPVLKERGYFLHPPEVEDLGDGRVNLPNWWPIRYLARMATLATDDAIQIVEELPDFDNPQVYNSILDIALQLTGAASGRLKSRLIEYANLPDTLFSYRLPELLLHWTREGQTEAALELAKKMVYFAPDPEVEEKQIRRRENPRDWTTMLQPRPRLEQWDYLQMMEKGIRPLIEAEPYQVALLLISAVNALTYDGMHRDEIDTAGEEDHSELWHPSLRGPTSEVLRPSDGLVGTMTLACERVWATQPDSIGDLDSHLRTRRWKIFRRLRQHLYSLHPNQQTRTWIREEILNHENYAQWEHHYDFQRMIRQACESLHGNLLTRDELTAIFNAILDGPDREIFQQFAGESYTGELFQQRQRHFHRMQLRPFRAVLFGEYQDYFQELEDAADADISDVDYRQVGEARSGMVSSRSPRTGGELASLPDEDLLEYINNWDDEHPDDKDWLIEVTIEALAESFEVFFRDTVMPSPDRLQFWLANRDRIQRPIYVRAMLDAMRALIRDQDFSNLNLWLEICEWVLTHPDGERVPSLRPPDRLHDNPYWGSCRRAAEDLASDLLKTCHGNQLPLPLDAVQWLSNFFGALCTQYDWALDEDQRVFPGSDDWLSEAINNARSSALQDLIRFATLLRRDNPAADIRVVTETLERRLVSDNTFPMTLPERAILGANYETIIALDGAWAIENKPALFPSDNLNAWSVAFSAFLQFHRPNRPTFEILQDDFGFAIQHFNDLAENEPTQSETADVLGEKLFRYYIGGQYPLLGQDSLIEQYYQSTESRPERQAGLFKQVGLMLYHTKEGLASDIVDRFKDFFDWRLGVGNSAELAGFEFWLQAACLEPKWRLNAFLRVLDLWQAGGIPDWFNWASIAEMIPEHTGEVVKCFAKIVEGYHGNSMYIWPEPTKRILKAGFDNPEEAVREETRRTRETLLNSGHFNMAMLEN